MKDLLKDATNEEVFTFLDELREEGSTNMMGATADIRAEFNCDKRVARDLLFEWMDTFEVRHG